STAKESFQPFICEAIYSMASLLNFLFYSLLRKMGTGRVFYTAAQARRDQLTEELLAKYGHHVQSGPFTGMELLKAGSRPERVRSSPRSESVDETGGFC